MAFNPDSTNNVTVRRFYSVMSSLWTKIKNKIPAPSTTTPVVDGTATKGTDAGYARGDHVHPTDTSREAASNKKTTLNVSSNTEFPTSKAVATFVNSSIATATANFLGTYDVVADLGLTTAATNAQIATALGSHTWPSGISPTNNDYVFVSVDDPGTTTESAEYRRFKYNGSAWEYEYTLNNSSFTQAQWDAINSGVTASFVTNAVTGVKGSNESTYRTGQVSISKSNVGLGSVVNTGDSPTPVSGGTTKFTTGGAYTELAKKAPNDHSSTDTTYGVASATKYGHVKLDNSTPLTVGTLNADGVATGKAHIHNALESVARASVTTADLDHVHTTNERAHMILSQITSATSTTHDPGDGYMLSFMWDNAGKYDAQIYIPDADSSASVDYGRLKIRYANNYSWGDWSYLPAAAQSKMLSNANSDDIDTIYGNKHGEVLSYYWSSSTAPTGADTITGLGSAPTAVMQVFKTHSASYTTQVVYTANNGIYARHYNGNNGNWTAWNKVLISSDIITSTTTNGAINVAGTDVTVYTHPTSGANVSKGDTTNQTPGFGSTFKVTSGTVDNMGHTTTFAEHTVKIPNATATASAAGLMSADDYKRLNGSRDIGEHDADLCTADGFYYGSSNMPATTLGWTERSGGGTDGAIFVQAHSSSWVGQIAQDYRTGNLFTRGRNNGTFTSWKRIPYLTVKNKGGTTTPVYVDANGEIQSCTAYASATVGTATNSTNSAVTADTTHQLYLIGATGSSGQQALKTDTGIYATATAGQLHATTFDINSKCTLQFNTTTNALDFVFA